MNLLKKRIYLFLLALTLLLPIGFIVPRIFHSGGGWGEWSSETVNKHEGYAPEGMQKDEKIWKAPLPDYGNSKRNSIFSGSIWYILSGVAGIAIITLVTWGFYKFYQNHE